MSVSGCELCTVVEALGRAETCPASAPGQVLRKIQDLPASIAILAPDQYYRDMLRVAAAVAAAFRPRKMNYEVLGNTVAHLHWHLFPRPTWERSHAPRLPGPDEYAETLAAICRHLR